MAKDPETTHGIVMNMREHLQGVFDTFGLNDRPVYSMTIKVRPGELTMVTIEAEVKAGEIETAWESYEMVPMGKAGKMQETIDSLQDKCKGLRNQMARMKRNAQT